MKNTAPLSPQGHEVMSTQFAIHQSDPDKNTFGGLASVYDHMIDTWIPTRIKPGAFTKTLKENARRVKVLYQHNEYMPLGLPTKMEETSDGLLVEGKISLTSYGKDCMILLADKVIDEMSIGFDPIKFEMVEEQIEDMTVLVRHITELRLWEFSPVTWGANSKAKITNVNSVEHLLETLGLSSDKSKSFLKEVLIELMKNPAAEPTDLCRIATQRLEAIVASEKPTPAAEPPVIPALTDITESLRELDVLDLELLSKH